MSKLFETCAQHGRYSGRLPGCPKCVDDPPQGLRARCKAMYQKMGRDAMLRQGDPVEDLTAFVVSEIGRAADSKLENSLPLCLYFSSEQDREEFVAAVREAKPGMVARQWPR